MPNPARILIVDDIEMNRHVLQDLVIVLGHEPVLAENGNEALEKIEKEAPDMILLDILMPGMDGYEVLGRIKANKRYSHIPVIVISGVDELESAAKCISQGAEDYIAKPFNPTLLRARISGCLEKKLFRDRERQLLGELREKYEALQRAENGRNALFSMIVHDLRGPLTRMLLVAEVMQRCTDTDNLSRDKFDRDINQILCAAEDMASLIQSILDISKLEAGEMPVLLGELDASQFLKNIFHQFFPQAEKMGINLRHDPGQENIGVKADQDLLSRVLQNLLGNAFKYSEKGSEVSLSLEQANGEIIFCVEDEGPGIPEEYKDKIFNKFFQVKSGLLKKIPGVGLGLAFCKMAIEAQGGGIWAENRETKGTAFKFSLKAM